MAMLLSLLLISSTSFAFWDDLMCTQFSLKLDPQVSKEAVAKAKEQCIVARQNQAKINSLQGTIDSITNQSSDCMQGVYQGQLPSRETLDKCAAERVRREAEVTKLKADLITQQTVLTKAQREYETGVDSTKAEADARAKLIADGEKYFDFMRSSIYDQRLTAADFSEKLNNMARAIDNSAMGLYMRDRLAGLMNSDVMCKAVKQCPAPSTIKGSDLNAVFNDKVSTYTIPPIAVPKSGAGAGTVESAKSKK